MGSEKHVHSGRILYLDGWRGLSLIAVLIGHFTPGLRYPLAQLGVEMFFVLSGRLMADILFVERYPLGEFYKRRLSRVFPGMAAFVLTLWVATSTTAYGFKPLAAASALTFTLNYAMVFGHGVAAIENLWSLCIEEHAYLLLGVLALCARRGFPAFPAILLIAAASLLDGAVSTVFLHQDYRTVYWRTDAHVASVMLGAASYLWMRGRTVPAWLTPAAVLAAAALWFGPDLIRYSLAPMALALAIAGLDQAPAAVRQGLSLRAVRFAGLCSYSVYLWQQPFARLSLDGSIPPWAGAGLAVVFGLISYFWVEQPARRYLNARLRLTLPRLFPPKTERAV